MATDLPEESPPAAPARRSAAWDFAGTVRSSDPPSGTGRSRVPEAIERRYLRIDDRYFFPDRTLAFIDEGNRIRVRSENREVLHGVVAIAQVRGWRVVELEGSETFRQAMWREATLRGIEARGYAPRPAEVLQVQRARDKWQRSPEAGPGSGSQPSAPDPESTAAPGGFAPPEAAHLPAKRSGERPNERPGGGAPLGEEADRHLRDGPRPPVRGTLVAAAAAPYQFDPAQRMSFYVMVRTELGDRTIWGSDLERALAESASRPRVGDAVVLTRHGTRPVPVRVPARNAAGELVGDRTIVAQRARWSIETPEHLHTLAHHAMLVRTGDISSGADPSITPALAAATAGLRLAEQFARRVTADAASQQGLVQLIRERMAHALEQGRAIRLPERRANPRPAPAATPVRRRTPADPDVPSHERQ